MPTRTLPTRDVTLVDGRRLYYQQGESRQHANQGQHASVYMTKRGPDGALRILITVDDEPARGEHYHLSGSYPERTPTPDEMVAALKVLIPGGGQFGAVTPERNRHALHGHVVHLIEEPPQYLAQHAREGQPRDETTAEVYARSESSPPIAPTDDAATRQRGDACSVSAHGPRRLRTHPALHDRRITRRPRPGARPPRPPTRLAAPLLLHRETRQGHHDPLPEQCP